MSVTHQKADLLFTSWDAGEVAELTKILDQVPHRTIRPVRESHVIKDVVLPYVLTADGQRIVGLDAIRAYLLGHDPE